MPDDSYLGDLLFVVLEQVGDHRLEAIKQVRALTGLDLQSSKAVVDNAPCVVLATFLEDRASYAVRVLQAAGCAAMRDCFSVLALNRSDPCPRVLGAGLTPIRFHEWAKEVHAGPLASGTQAKDREWSVWFESKTASLKTNPAPEPSAPAPVPVQAPVRCSPEFGICRLHVADAPVNHPMAILYVMARSIEWWEPLDSDASAIHMRNQDIIRVRETPEEVAGIVRTASRQP